MTQEEKELLLVDLCARLPYLVRCTYPNDIGLHIPITEINIHDNGLVGIHGKVYNLYDIKPYLRPMLSMTEEEKKELKADTCSEGTGYFNEKCLIYPISHYGEQISYDFMSVILEWLNSHHFDYRGLIEKGLALEAPKDMYND